MECATAGHSFGACLRELLERRPDVADAERQLASANARIGMAKAAFFPVVRLTGSGGFVSGDIESLFNWESRVWSLGPSVSLPIFAGGRNLANLNRSRAVYEEAVAKYRQRVLVAFGDVENSLSGVQFLARQAAAQDRAVVSARRGLPNWRVTVIGPELSAFSTSWTQIVAHLRLSVLRPSWRANG